MLDLHVKAIALERDGHQCVVDVEGARCKRGPLSACHVLPKGRYPRLRFEVENIFSACYYHHIIWQHRHPLEFAAWFHSKYPGRYERLQVMAATSRKVDLKELALVWGVK